MATIKSRLDKIENSLTPKQAVVAWMEEAHKFATPDDYVDWLAKHPGEQLPLNRLADQVELATYKWMKGAPRDELERVIRNQVREVAFLFFLQRRVNLGFQCELRSLRLLAVLAFEHVRTASQEQRRSRRTPPSVVNDPFREAGSLAFEVLGHKGVVEDVANKYFDGHPVLFRGLAEDLAQLVEEVHTIRDEYKSLALQESLYRKGKERRVGVGYKYRIDWERLKTLEERVSFKCSESLIEMARAEALSFLGEPQASFQHARKSWLISMQGGVVEESESSG